MWKCKTSVSFLLLAILPGILLVWTACTDDYRGEVEGVVTFTEPSIYPDPTPLPLPDAEVIALSLKNGREVSAFTDENGYYHLWDVQYGLNELRVVKDGYFITEPAASCGDCYYADVMRSTSTELDILMTRIAETVPASLLVEVVDPNYLPIRKATVDLYQRYKDDYGFTEFYDTYLQTLYTNDAGKIAFVEFDTISELQLEYFMINVAARHFQNSSHTVLLSFFEPTTKVTIVLQPADE